MQYGFKLVFPDQQALTLSGYGKVARIPAIFDSQSGYSRLPSRFLIDRALGVWDPAFRGAKPNPRTPSRTSIKDYGDWLCNALEWAAVRSIDLMTCDYTSVLIGRYQKEMLKGIWSKRGEPLASRTVNPRVGMALEFQMWCADKGYRDSFLIPTETRAYKAGSYATSKGHQTKTVEARKGKVKVNKHSLVFPSNDEIRVWRNSIYEQPIVGPTHGLMVDHILETAIRRAELSCWRVDTLPLDPNNWIIVNPRQPEALHQVSISLKNGTKGQEFYIDEYDDKLGPPGDILVPLWFCKKIDKYRNTDRLLALKHLTRGVRDIGKVRKLINQSVHLYLNPKTGLRYTGDQIYQLWTNVEGPKHWCPHLGRDWWACQYLWQKMQEHAALIKQLHGVTKLTADHPLLRALKDTAVQVIQLEIKPQLRHVSAVTTETYLQWLFDQLRVSLNLTRQWHEEDGNVE